MRIPGFGSKQGNYLSSEKINKYVAFEDSVLPGSSYQELQQFREDIAQIAKKSGVKVSIYNAKRDLPNLHSKQQEEVFSNNVGVRILRKKKPQISFLVNYPGHNGKLSKSFVNRFFAQLQINLDILNYKNDLINKTICTLMDYQKAFENKQQALVKLVKSLVKIK